MSEMVERAARAMFEREPVFGDSAGSKKWTFDTISLESQNYWRANARAAIAAMREPSEAMFRAYNRALTTLIEATPSPEKKWKTRRLGPHGSDRGYKIPPAEKARCRWQAMLDAALADEPR